MRLAKLRHGGRVIWAALSDHGAVDLTSVIGADDRAIANSSSSLAGLASRAAHSATICCARTSSGFRG